MGLLFLISESLLFREKRNPIPPPAPFTPEEKEIFASIEELIVNGATFLGSAWKNRGGIGYYEIAVITKTGDFISFESARSFPKLVYRNEDGKSVIVQDGR